MKKIIYLGMLAGALLLAVPALAVTNLNLSPAAVNVKTGQSFNVTITVDPQGGKTSTIKLELSFPAALLKVESFTFGDSKSWIAWSQPGYDTSIDDANANGILIKTAGYPGGTMSSVIFGVVKFTAKNSGPGTIKTTANSLALSDTNQNVLSTIPGQASVTVVAPTVAVKAPGKTVVAQVSATPTPTSEITLSPTISPIVQPVTLAAAIGNILTLGTGKTFVGIIVTILFILLAYYLIRRILSKKKKDLS